MANKFIAFISYSRKDKDVAEWLHSKLENFELPKEESIKNIFKFESKYFRPVFIDLKDLHVEERPFTDEIKEALSNSEYLIVLCSHNSAVSPFVTLEIDYFLKTHNNNLSRIVPLFIDEVNGSIPKPFIGSSIMERHFPIYNSRLSVKSEANNYCFYQIISYILGIDFAKIYNRYEVQSAKEARNKRKRIMFLSGCLLSFLVILSLFQYEVIKRKERHINLEKTVFPAAVVDGYEKNFMTPVINYLKKTPSEFSICILMPETEKDLQHQDRVNDFEYRAKVANVIDSIKVVQLETETKRGSRIIQVVKNGNIIDNLYLDFATTSSSFLAVANYKKHFKEYEKTPKDVLIKEYSDEFIRQVNNRLGRDSVYVQFFTNPDSLIDYIKSLE